MSIENANLVHAILVFTSANPPVVDAERSRGIAATGSVARSGAGTFEATLLEPVTPGDAVVASATISSNATAGIINAEIGADGNIDIVTKSAVNTAADGGTVTVVIYRLPTID